MAQGKLGVAAPWQPTSFHGYGLAMYKYMSWLADPPQCTIWCHGVCVCMCVWGGQAVCVCVGGVSRNKAAKRGVPVAVVLALVPATPQL